MRRYRKAGRIPVFGKGAELKTVSLPLRDLDMLRMLKPSQDQILAIYGVPKSKFGMMDGEGYANAATADKNYQENCLLPRARTFDEIMTDLISPRVFGTEQARGLFYETESPVEADRDFVLKKAESKFKNGAITVNQFNQEIGDDPIGPDGEVYFIPNSVTVVKSLSEAAGGAATEISPQPTGPAQAAATGEAARRFRLEADGAADRIGVRLALLAKEKQAGEPDGRNDNIDVDPLAERRAKENVRLRRENSRLRFAAESDRLERVAKSKVRALFTREQKAVEAAIEENVRDAVKKEELLRQLGRLPETRDWLDTVLGQFLGDWRELLDAVIASAATVGWRLLQEEVVGALVVNERTVSEAARRQATLHAHELQTTSLNAIREMVRKGVEEGKALPDILRRVGELYDGWKGSRSELIAQTETGPSMNWGRYQAAKETALRIGMDIRRSWISIDDNKTRDSHAAADSEVNERNRDIGLDDFYDIAGVAMSHPGDWSAPPQLVMNCRCSEWYRDASGD
ncbi:MAG: phage portal protein [Acidobacteria bacterium]|nr:phage portal protein [Acidobacteriota bacterium]